MKPSTICVTSRRTAYQQPEDITIPLANLIHFVNMSDILLSNKLNSIRFLTKTTKKCKNIIFQFELKLFFHIQSLSSLVP
jgi:hypothetical protein